MHLERDYDRSRVRAERAGSEEESSLSGIAKAAKLPSLTEDLETARRDLAAWGYAMIANALTAEQVRECRERLRSQAAAEEAAGIGHFDNGELKLNQRVWNLVNKGKVFRDLLFHPVLREMLPELLGKDYTLSSLTANIAAPGGEPMPLHSDQGYAPRSVPIRVVVNTAWMLEDHAEENGGTRLVPGSHLWPELPEDKPDVQSIAATGPAGTMVMFDGRLWHGTGANRSTRRRRLLLGYFCRPWIRPQENFTLSLLDELYEEASPELLGLLGFRTYGTLGNVNGVIVPNGALIERGRQVGPMEGTLPPE